MAKNVFSRGFKFKHALACVWAGLFALSSASAAAAITQPVLLVPTDVLKGEKRILPREIIIAGSGAEQGYEAFAFKGKAVSGGLWAGEPTTIRVDSYPEDEMFTLISGSLALEGKDGKTIRVMPGDTVIVPKGWAGVWKTLEKSVKSYVVFD
jgi:uncharacterized protein